MGGQSFVIRQKGTSCKNAYNLAVENAIEEYGNDVYNGTISTTSGNFRDVTLELRKSGKEKMQFIKEMIENMNKRDCYSIEEISPVSNNNKIKSIVEHTVVKGTSKWELKYNVYTGWEDRQLKSFKTKGDAVKFARGHTEKTRNTTFVRMEKVLVNQNANTACIKYKESSQEKEGTYILFGIAAE